MIEFTVCSWGKTTPVPPVLLFSPLPKAWARMSCFIFAARTVAAASHSQDDAQVRLSTDRQAISSGFDLSASSRINWRKGPR